MGEAMASCYRLNVYKQWRISGLETGHSELLKQMKREVCVTRYHSDRILPKYQFVKDFEVIIPSRNTWEEMPEVQEGNTCYTDGSRNNERELSGAGVYIPSLGVEQSIPLGKYATVPQTELFAILTCAQTLVNQEQQEEEVVICSDSQGALRALKAAKVTSALVLQCILELNNLAQRMQVLLAWVPGHHGIEGNEQADQLAREASSLPLIGEPKTGISFRVVRLKLRQWTMQKHKEHWEVKDGCKQAKQFLEGPNVKTARRLLSLPRKQLRVVTGLLTGHCALNRHLALLKIAPHPDCDFCEMGEETSLHFLGDCDFYAATRQFYFGKSHLNVDEIKTLTLRDFLRFTKATGRFDE